MDESPEGESQADPRPVRALFGAAARLRGVDVSSLAAVSAYFAILAIAPFLLFLVAGIAVISQVFPIGLIDDLERTVERMAPGDTGELLLPLVEEAVDRSDRGTLSFGMLSAMVVALWSSARAIGSLLDGAATISGRSVHRTMLWNRLIALLLAVGMGTVVMLSLAVFLFGGVVGRAVAGWIGLGDTFADVWALISWPLVAVIVLLVLSVFYRFSTDGPSERLNFISSGAIIATLLWMLVMLGIRLFLEIVEPGSIYGALGSFVVLVVFFYIMSLALLFGEAVNAEMRGDSNAQQSEAQPG